MNKLVITLFLLPLIASCNLKEFKMDSTDSKTKLHVKGDGLISEKPKLLVNGEEIHRNHFYEGEKIEFLFNDVQGLTRKNGISYPSLTILVEDNNGKVLLETDNLLEGEKIDEERIKITRYLDAILKGGTGEQYNITLTIKDTKGKGVLTAEMPFTVEPTPILEVTANNVDYNMIYMWDANDKVVVTDSEIQAGKDYVIFFNKVDGIEHLVLPFHLIDAHGDTLLTSDNLFEEMTPEDRIQSKEQFSAKFQLYENVTNPVRVICQAKDLNSENDIHVVAKLEVK